MTTVLADPPVAAPPKSKPKKLPLEVKIPVGALAGSKYAFSSVSSSHFGY